MYLSRCLNRSFPWRKYTIEASQREVVFFTILILGMYHFVWKYSMIRYLWNVLMDIYLQWSKWLGPWKIYRISKICSKNCILVLCQKPKLCYRILYIKTLLLHESSLYPQWNLTDALGDTQNKHLAEYLTWLLFCRNPNIYITSYLCNVFNE